MSDAQDEANWRDWQAEHLGLLDPGQPTETATVNHRKRMEAEFSPAERRMIRYLLLCPEENQS